MSCQPLPRLAGQPRGFSRRSPRHTMFPAFAISGRVSLTRHSRFRARGVRIVGSVVGFFRSLSSRDRWRCFAAKAVEDASRGTPPSEGSALIFTAIGCTTALSVGMEADAEPVGGCRHALCSRGTPPEVETSSSLSAGIQSSAIPDRLGNSRRQNARTRVTKLDV